MRDFETQAGVYESIALVQAEVAGRLARRLGGAPGRILEIGCGTGLFSAHLAARFPQAALLLTDLSPAMLGRARARLGARAEYLVMDGQWPAPGLGSFDLIASSMALQWFDDLPGGLARLAASLAPGGVLRFATLGAGSFAAWRAAHEAAGLDCGLRDYARAQDFPWPAGFAGRIEAETIEEPYETALAFLRGMRALGAAASPEAHRPVGAGRLRRLLAQFSGGFTARYEVLYGELRRAP